MKDKFNRRRNRTKGPSLEG